MIQLVNLVTRFIFKDDFSPMELAHAKFLWRKSWCAYTLGNLRLHLNRPSAQENDVLKCTISSEGSSKESKTGVSK